MSVEGRRVTILPTQLRRLAELADESSGAIEVIQDGGSLYLNNGSTRLHINANGDDIKPPNQEPLC